ncbi:ATP-dependent DNA ligase [Paenibacillus lacisoli]
MNPVTPFEPVSTAVLPQGPEWTAQVKWDGVRMLIYSDGQQVRLINRKHNERTLQYPELLNPADYCLASSFILDGELVAWQEGKPSFHEIMKRDSLRKSQSIMAAVPRVPVTYMVFDLLYLNGNWVMERPLSERQQLLQQIIRPQSQVQLVHDFPDGESLFKAIEQQGMEGVICKRLDSPYVLSGKDKRWQKKKISRDLYAVIGGVTYRDGMVNALLLGLYGDEDQLIYIGHAGAGRFTVRDWRNLTEMVELMKTPHRPFSNIPERSKDAVWLKPEISVKVSYLEWTPGGTMRHPGLESLSPHVKPQDCRIDQV